MKDYLQRKFPNLKVEELSEWAWKVGHFAIAKSIFEDTGYTLSTQEGVILSSSSIEPLIKRIKDYHEW